MVVEHRRATGQRQLREAGARRRVLGLVVDRGPDRIQGPQPAEQVFLLRAGAGEVLPEMVMRVDQPGRYDCALQIRHVAGLGSRPVADVLHEPFVDEDPAALVLGAVVVHRHDVRVGEQRAHARSGTSSKRSTSTSPRSVIFRLGITDSARNASSWNGASIVQPSSAAAATIA